LGYPLLSRRAPTDKKAIEIGAKRLSDIPQDQSLPFTDRSPVIKNVTQKG
jgi:hypothetical protein